jgi:dihydroorotate dehydrogenase electron transfer subunit
MAHDITTPVLDNADLGHGNYLLEFGSAEMARAMQPAQFFMIGIPGSATLLRRPYSVCGLPGTFESRPAAALQVLYKVVGRGTGLLASLKAGAAITVLGPLGRGFGPPAEGARPVLVAGGIGSAPFPALCTKLDDRSRPPLMFYGARQAGELPLADWFREHTELTVTTDDGSAGRHGLVTEPLAELLERQAPESLHLYACGPEPMLKAVARLALERGVACELSLEAHMACGFGVCLGCVVPVRGERTDGPAYDRVCVEGPVMRAERMAW